MESQQDFKILQAKFQASQPEPSELPRKPPKPEFNKLKKFPQLELSQQPSKPTQHEFMDLKKLPQPEFTDLPRKPLQSQIASLTRKPPQPKFGELSKKSPQLDVSEVPQALHQLPKIVQKPLQPEFSNPTRPSSELKPSMCPKKFQKPESSEAPLRPSQSELSSFPKKPPKPQAGVLTSKSLPQHESSKVPLTPLSKSRLESSEPPHGSLQPEFNSELRKLQDSGHPNKTPEQPKFCEVPQMPPWKLQSGDPQPHSPQQNFSEFPKKLPQLQLSNIPRTPSEPEVSVFPKGQPKFMAFSKKAPQPKLGGLPRTSSEPEFGSLSRKFPKPESKNLPQPECFRVLPRKASLPSTVSESCLPTAMAGSSPKFPLSPGFVVTGTPRWRSDDFQLQHPPQRRLLPSSSSLGTPPAKPPRPPSPINIQNFQRPSAAAATALQRTGSSAGTHSQTHRPKHILQNLEEMYELYDDVEPTEDSSSLRDRDQVHSTYQATRRPPQEPELKKKATQPQQLPPMDPKLLKQIRKAEKAEKEFRKKFKFEGEIVIHTRMMIDPNAKTRRGGGKYLGIRRGEILEVIEFTSKEEMLCRDPKGKYGYVPRTALLPLETEVYDDVGFYGMYTLWCAGKEHSDSYRLFAIIPLGNEII
uniref:PML-RARA-regulated adapter molecule 1 n=1 Tax=Jaculus jaculus TaxID=51337 RepID=UPI001E1B24B0|nr:PML-RARA-regulated adapter molecule 1 [Jaculus jaculus]